MGHSASTNESPVQEELRLSETERNYVLDLILSTEKESALDLEKFKKSIDGNISSELVDQVLLFLRSRCVLEVGKFDSEKLLNDIFLLTYGQSDDLANILYLIMNADGNSILKIDFENILINSLSSLSFKSSHFNVCKCACQRYANFILEGKNSNQFSEEEFLDLFKKREMILKDVFQTLFLKIFLGKCLEINKDLLGHCTVLTPSIETQITKNALEPNGMTLALSDVIFLNTHLPLHLQHKWRLLYSTRLQGESFSRLSTQALNQGPLLIVVKDTGGYVFGGFVSTNLVYSSKFQGNENSFLFTISPTLAVHNTTGYNDHYAYFNVGQETMPNGFGMGGQHGYYGLWVSAEFGKGHSKAKTKSTTYGSPQLSEDAEFSIAALEVWGVGEERREEEEEEEEEGSSVIDKRPDIVAMLQIAGKERVSEGYRDSEQSSTALPDDHQLYQAHDAMN